MKVPQQPGNQLLVLSVYEAVPSVVARLEMFIETLSQQLKALDAEIEETRNTGEKWAESVTLLETITGSGFNF